jgi:hypothetical protein
MGVKKTDELVVKCATLILSPEADKLKRNEVQALEAWGKRFSTNISILRKNETSWISWVWDFFSIFCCFLKSTGTKTRELQSLMNRAVKRLEELDKAKESSGGKKVVEQVRNTLSLRRRKSEQSEV